MSIKSIEKPVRTKRKHESAPEDFTNFDEKEFHHLTATEAILLIITAGLLVLCFVEAINFGL